MTEPAVAGDSFRTILGIRFFTGTAQEAVNLASQGGLVTIPSAPVLVTMTEDADTREALGHSDLALTDSGLMVSLWNSLHHDQVPRLSGLEYLTLLLKQPELKEPGAMFWIMPGKEALLRTQTWLVKSGFQVTPDDFYVAPLYPSGPLTDPELLKRIEARHPRHVFTAIGGGVQERLGYYLKKNLSQRPAIHCIGAAIGFLTGDQVRIPMWADRARLGWFFRCLSAPTKFIPRYLKALRLVPIMLKGNGHNQ
jgi:UDP-N-acetyl-D-mannosaminuronic acid transferase (WecB/TagA/CpsF family)